MNRSRSAVRCAALTAAIALIATLASAQQEGVLLDGSRFAAAALLDYDSSAARRTASLATEEETIAAKGLVRWGEPALPRPGRPAIGMVDGSVLLSDRTWSPAGLVRVTDKTIELRRGSGWVEVAREQVRWLVLDAEKAGLSLDRLPTTGPTAEETIYLASGDQLEGQISGVTDREVTAQIAGEAFTAPLESVVAIRFAAEGRAEESPCLIGLADGSLLRADWVLVAVATARIDFAGTMIEPQAEEVVYLQPLDERVTYLSDLEPVDYQHTPYLDLVWPYARDAGLRGRPLVGGEGHRRVKGLAMHSAARLIYRLNDSHSRFRADLAIADPSLESSAPGSVVFRVYLVKEGAFEAAYQSPIVRAGDAPLPIEVDLAGAAALALVVDYGDGGDAGDEALWLDARLEK